jgi:iron complex outermembrane recepter protein
MKYDIVTKPHYFLIALLFSQPSYAAGIEEIVVTAQKREQSIQDVPISITAFDGELLEELNINNSNDLVYMTPGLSLGNPGGEGNITSLSLRGIGQGDFADHQESPVAVYTDGVYNAYMGSSTSALYDQDRVEVLRGPQGTLFGRNATGGLVHYISRKPTQEFEAYGDATYGSYDQVRLEAAAGGGITDNISGRISVFSNDHDPFVDNNGTGNDGNEADTWSIRPQLLFSPSDNLDVLLKFQHTKTDINQWYYETAPATVNAAGQAVLVTPPAGSEILDGDPFTVSNDGNIGNALANGANPEGLERDDTSGSVTIDWDLANGMTVSSITAYTESNKLFNQDSDGLAASVVTFGTDTNAKQISQEIRLAGETENSRWVTGFYYLDYENSIFLDVDFLIPDAFTSTQVVDTKNWSIFGQVEYDFAADWTILAGLRYLDEEKDMTASGQTFGGSGTFVGKVEEDDIAGKLQLSWTPNDDWLYYAGVSRGVKAGGFNAAFGNPAGVNTYKKETPISYEAGFKSTLFNGKAQWNASAYYYDYKNYQAFAFVALAQQVFNTDAKVYGIDSNLFISPNENWDFNFGINIMDSEAEDVANAGGVVADRNLPNAPDLQFTGLAKYSWQALNGNMAVMANFNYQSENSFTIFEDPASTIEGYVVGNARLSYKTPDEKLGVAFFVNNIADNEYITSISNNAGFPAGLGHVQRFYARPRWFGAELTFDY